LAIHNLVCWTLLCTLLQNPSRQFHLHLRWFELQVGSLESRSKTSNPKETIRFTSQIRSIEASKRARICRRQN